MKLLLPILLTTSLFAQDKSNQISYTIETTTGYYQNISIALVDDASIEVYYRNLKDKFKIPLGGIKSLKQNGLKSDQDAIFIGTLGGGLVGLIAVAASPGIPSVKVGIKAPPHTALFADSDAITPSGSPFPKLLGFFENLLA